MTTTIRPITLAAVGAIIVSTFAAHSLSGQAEPSRSHLEFLISSGRLVPTGNRNNVIQAAGMTTAQLSYMVRPTLGLTGTFAWARSRDLGSLELQRLDIFGYDLGAEFRTARPFGNGALTFRPFAGAGAGGRSYDYRHLDVDASHHLAAYASAGGDLGVRRVHLRVEVRNYISGFTPLQGGGSTSTRNDVVVMFGLRLAKR